MGYGLRMYVHKKIEKHIWTLDRQKKQYGKMFQPQWIRNGFEEVVLYQQYDVNGAY